MRILVPLNNKEYLDRYINAGAGEFYLGFYDHEWNDEFGEYSDINRMSGYKEKANQYNLDEVINIINVVKKKGSKIYITFNSSIYAEKELCKIKEYMEQLKNTEVDGVIVSNPELVMIAKEIGLFSVVSTIAGVYNSDIVKFYKDIGVKRVILPRDLSLNEIEQITKEETNMEYEVFIMRNGCTFSDSNCLGFHRTELCSICANVAKADEKILVQKGVDNFRIIHDIELNDMILRNNFHKYSCGICSIYDFLQLKISACKIVGRSDDCDSVCEDIELIFNNINIAKKCDSREEYLKNMQFPNERKYMCKLGLSCYYPEIRF